MFKEARAILQALGQPAGTGSNLQVLSVLMTIALGHLRSLKAVHDVAKAARDMDARIKDPRTPRPTFQEASQN